MFFSSLHPLASNYSTGLACAGRTMRLECPVDTIRLVDTFFGYNSTVQLGGLCAGRTPSLDCTQHLNAYTVVSRYCQGEQYCKVLVSDEFEDPCGDVWTKFLWVNYTCRESSTTPTPKIPVEPTISTSSSGNFTGQGPESSQELKATCSGCLVWKIFVPVLVMVFMILVCVIVFMAKR
ncbi:hypothetical protein HOLleu_01796 [Holothuria leucospilota]|uniref:SUEL-type lectin domain-containing protein n=1 Tax=Holothuria leucospilota TaxID=206669 RepID=A0A9Q1CRH5_HOLLE|nr:hypothetical protein HOLleu_01796 [Holothuria leucospilota]